MPHMLCNIAFNDCIDLTDGTSSTSFTLSSQRKRSSCRCEKTDRGRCIRISNVHVCQIESYFSMHTWRTGRTILSRQGNHAADGSSESSFPKLRARFREPSTSPVAFESFSTAGLESFRLMGSRSHYLPCTAGSRTSPSSASDLSKSLS